MLLGDWLSLRLKGFTGCGLGGNRKTQPLVNNILQANILNVQVKPLNIEARNDGSGETYTNIYAQRHTQDLRPKNTRC